MQSLSLSKIQDALQEIALRRRLGDRAVSLSEVARLADLSRETVHQAARGERIAERSRIRLGRALIAIREENRSTSRFMHVKIGHGGPILGIGLGVRGANR